MSLFAQQFQAALQKAMSRSEAASLAGKASAAARRAKAGGSAPASGGSAFDQASAKANALIAANPGKYGPKGAKGKAKGKGKAGAKPKAAKDPAAAKAKAAKEQQAQAEHAQRQQEHEADRAEHQKEHAQAQTEHAQSRAEHEADRTARRQQQAKREKQQAQKQKQTKQKAQSSKSASAPKAAAPVAPVEVAAAASALSSGGQLTSAQSQQLITNGLAKPQKDGSLVLTSTGLKAAQQTQKLVKARIAAILEETGLTKAINSIEQQRAVFASMGSSGKAWPRGKNGKRSPHAGPKLGGGESPAAVAAEGSVTTTTVHDSRPQGQRPALSAPISGDMEAHARFVAQQTALKAVKQQQRQLKTKLKATNAKLGIPTPKKITKGDVLAKAFSPVSAWHGWAAITKVDEEQRVVYGIASSELPDNEPGIWKGESYQGDVISSDAMRDAAPDYLKFPAIREMHQPVAAGTAVHFEVTGAETLIGAHIVDDQAWAKVVNKVYRGFSIGGKCKDAEIVKIAGRPFRKVTALELTEISLVDRPRNPDAKITLYKGADMDPEQDATEVAEETIAKAADPTKAIALLQQLRNDAETSGDMDAADEYTAAIRSVAQAAGIATTAADDTDTEPDADDAGLAMDDGTGDDDMAMAASVGDLRKAHPELSDEGLIALLLTQRTAPLAKRGAMLSNQNMGHLQNAHDSLQKATGGAVCAQPGQPNGIAQAAMLAPDDLAKAVAPAFEGIAKLLEQNGLKVDSLVKRLEHLEKQPAPGAPASRVVAVEKSLPGADVSSTPDPEAATLTLLKSQRENVTDTKILAWIGEEIAKIEVKRAIRAR